MSLPDFSNTSRFPAFSACPHADAPPDPDASQSHVLIGTIAENMTVSTSPTFILRDRSSTSFALTLKVPKDQVQEGVPGGGYDVSGFKKGFTVVVPGARRSGVKDGKAGFVQTPSGSVQVIPAAVEKLLAMSAQEQDRAEAIGQKGWCQGCREIDTDTTTSDSFMMLIAGARRPGVDAAGMLAHARLGSIISTRGKSDIEAKLTDQASRLPGALAAVDVPVGSKNAHSARLRCVVSRSDPAVLGGAVHVWMSRLRATL
ncbi:hypothetical protein B2J93_1906 [Marssonina coronariae]|uniref:Uncharacterized protein n=1 Tax=Diplocarpon coronariae TaxID=2795749 RepID=A0A218YUD9_9HELO|nr:hypothetical protein B2J93_1906 [Marssonina coronariae]